jgi:large subunit ribosomal protein L23
MTTETATKTEQPKLPPHQVILRPLVTEKGTHRSTRHNAYAFEVSSQANKYDIRHAVEELFNVKVLQVRIQNRKGKPRRTRVRMGRTQDWKKAIVKLHPENRIDFF